MYLAFRHLVIYKWSTGYIMTCAKEGGKLWFSPSCSPHIQSHSFLSQLSLSLTHTHTTPHTTPPPMSLTCMLHSLDRHTVGNQNIITLSHTAANSGVATIQNSRAALTLNFHMKVGATKYRPAGRNWPAGREFETPGVDLIVRKKILVLLEHILQVYFLLVCPSCPRRLRDVTMCLINSGADQTNKK